MLVTENCAFQHLHLATFTPAAPTTLDVAALAAGARGDASDRAVATAPAIAAATCAPPASATIAGVPIFARTVAVSPPLEPPPAPPPRRAPTATSRTMPPPTLPVPEVVAPLQEGQVRPPGGGSTQSEKDQVILQVLELLLRRGDRRSCSRAPSSSLASGSLSSTVGEKSEKEQKILQCQDSVSVAGEALARTPLSSLARQPVPVGEQSEKDQMIQQVLELLLRRGDRRSCSRAPSSSLASGSLSATVREKSEEEQKILQCQHSVAVAGETLARTPFSSLARQPVHVAPETVHSASCTSRHSGKDEGGEREVRPPKVLSCQDVFGDKEGQSEFDLDTDNENLFDEKVTTFLREVSDQGKGVGDDTRVQPCGGMIPGDEETTFHRCTQETSKKKRTLQMTEGF